MLAETMGGGGGGAIAAHLDYVYKYIHGSPLLNGAERTHTHTHRPIYGISTISAIYIYTYTYSMFPDPSLTPHLSWVDSAQC